MSFYFTILDIPRHVSRVELRKAYHKQVLLWHPDRNKNSLYATVRFIDIAKAYSFLSSVRRVYRSESGPDRVWVPRPPPIPEDIVPQRVVGNIPCLYCQLQCPWRYTHHGSRPNCKRMCGNIRCYNCTEKDKNERRRLENPTGWVKREEKIRNYKNRNN